MLRSIFSVKAQYRDIQSPEMLLLKKNDWLNLCKNYLIFVSYSFCKSLNVCTEQYNTAADSKNW